MHAEFCKAFVDRIASILESVFEDIFQRKLLSPSMRKRRIVSDPQKKLRSKKASDVSLSTSQPADLQGVGQYSEPKFGDWPA